MAKKVKAKARAKPAARKPAAKAKKTVRRR